MGVNLFAFSILYTSYHLATLKETYLLLEWTFQYPPKPHQFTSIELKSSGLSSSTIGRLVEKKSDIEKEISDMRSDRSVIWAQLKDAKATLRLSSHIDDSKNNALKDIKKEYPTFFDEESNNTNQEGLNQVVKYLTDEYSGLQSGIAKLKKDIERIESKIAESEQLNEQLGESSNVNSMFLVLTRSFQVFRCLAPFIKCALPYFSFLATIYSLLFITFIFPSLDIPWFIQNIINYTRNLIKYEIATSIPILLWYIYTYGKKMNKIKHFIQTSIYIDIWVLLGIFIVIIFF